MLKQRVLFPTHENGNFINNRTKDMRRYSMIDMVKFAKVFDPEKPPMSQIRKYNKNNPEPSSHQKILNVAKAFREYEEDIKKMTDKELIEHVREDYHKDDFASKELEKRGLKL